MELSSSSPPSKRLKVESEPTYSDQDPDLDFEALRWSPTFVDKSMLIRSIMKDKAHRILLTAPPRFGKTAACNMLEMFFEIVNSEQQKLKKYKLFKDLKIYKCAEECTDDHDCESKRFFRQHCGQYPVISLDFAQLSSQSHNQLFRSLRDVITMQFKKYKCLIHKDDETYSWSNNNMGELDIKRFLRYLKDADDDDHWLKANDSKKEQYIFSAFTYLIKVLSVHYQHKKIIMLIDKFDAPFMEILSSENSNESIFIFLRRLTRLLCKDNVLKEFVQRVMIFSVTELGGMTSLGADNVQRRTFLDNEYDYYKFFGFTKEEVNTLVKISVTDSQQQKEALDEIAIWYNNYTVIGDKDITICNPVSIANYLRNLVRKSYWIASVGTKYVCQLFQYEIIQEKLFPAIRENKNISINTRTIDLDDISNLKSLRESLLNCDQEQFLQFLTECGYFNVIDKSYMNWTIQIPNRELKEMFTDKLHKALLLLRVGTNLFDLKQQESFVNALKSLGCGEEHEPMKYVTFKKSVENLYTNRKLPKAHFEFHCDLWRLIFRSGNFHCFSEMPIKEGCLSELDLIIITNCAAIIIEVKRHERDSAKNALEQCLQEEYYKAFQLIGDERKVLKKILIGVHLSDDGKVSIRYLENFEEESLQDKPNRKTLIKTIVEASFEC